ncbi:MAG: Maf family protein [Endozoicomonas sp.]
MQLLLASGSPYRKSLLQRLGLEFDCHSPDIDESPQPGENVETLARRLSRQKAEALRQDFPNHLIIASDQAAQLGSRILGKPGTTDKAIEQLSASSGHPVTFHTGVCLLNTKTGREQLDCVSYTVFFRELSRDQIEYYIKKEAPLDCAGSFKCEGLGISLFSKMQGDDPNSLIGLPLIRLTQMLLKEGVDVLARPSFS